jgi:hypothetical protein
MKIEQLEKINERLNRIAEIEKILAIKSSKIRISEYLDVHYRGLQDSANQKEHEVIVERELLEPALIAFCDKLKAELKELGLEV